MLQNTFIHIPKITVNSELKIWKSDVHTWQDFIDRKDIVPISASKKSLVVDNLHASIDALKKKKYSFFSGLPNNQHWRMYNILKDRTCFLDIETTGLSRYRDDITLIGIHGNAGTKIFMKGKNLGKFGNELKKYSMIVTFNGRCFDIPFIKHKFPDVNIDQYHADLRYMMAYLGFRGGLKNVERERGITREDDIEGVDGFEAVLLWHKYQRGNNDALTTLKKYLAADVENLRLLMNEAVIDLKQKYFYDAIKK